MTANPRRCVTAPARAARRLAATAVLALLCWLLAAAVPVPASAHAELVRTSPGDGQRLETAPAQVVLEFTEQVRLITGGIRLLDGGGQPLSTAPARVDGVSVIFPLPGDLPTGGYVLSWRVLSSDTHPVAGAFGFGVRADPPRAQAPARTVRQAAPGVRPVLMVGRWVGYAGLALLLGGVVFLLACWPGGRALPRARGLVAAGWTTAVTATIVGLLAQGPYMTGVGWSALSAGLVAETTATPFGVLSLARLALLVAAGLLVRALLRTARPRPFMVAAAGLLGVAVVATYPAAGHAASGRWSALAIGSDAVHVTAMSLWTGGLIMLAAAALRPRQADLLAGVALRFSALATASVTALAVTGAFQGWREVTSLSALTGSDYGRLLLGKLAVVAGVLAVGAVSRYAVRRGRDAAGRLRRTVPLEIGLVAVVLGITAVLGVTPPGRQFGAGTDQSPGPAQVALQMPDGSTAQLRVTPAMVGTNDVTVMVLDAAGQPRHVPQLTAQATLPERQLGPFDVHLTPDGHAFAGHVALPLPGTWRIDVTVRLSDLDAYVVSTPIRVGGKPR